MRARSYRSKIEVLRDFLRAAQAPTAKTRIIGAANLNQASFRRYLRICTDLELIVRAEGGYMATDRAGPLLETIDDLLVRTSELERSLQGLEPNGTGGRGLHGSKTPVFRDFYRQAWHEVVLQSGGSLSASRSGAIVLPSGGATEDSSSRGRSGTARGKVLGDLTLITARGAQPKVSEFGDRKSPPRAMATR